MSRTLLSYGLTALILAAALAPVDASARNSTSDGKRGRAATALWPSERPYHVDLGPVCRSRVPVLVRNPDPGPAYIWVVNIACDD